MAGLVITLAQQKGGSGKTTIAAHLAVAFLLARKSVAVLDIDPQGSLGEWFERREERLRAGETRLAFRPADGWGAPRETPTPPPHCDLGGVDTPPQTHLPRRS